MSFKVVAYYEKMSTKDIESKYSDPSNFEEVLAELKSSRTIGEVNELINRTFPDWQVATLTGFCEGYPHLTINWTSLCKKIGVPCAQIIVVRELAFDEDHMLLRNFMECLTRAGFSVKRMVDYVPCTKCEKIAVPTPQIHMNMKEKGITVPEVNITICKNCR
jgi:hypothetical protein